MLCYSIDNSQCVLSGLNNTVECESWFGSAVPIIDTDEVSASIDTIAILTNLKEFEFVNLGCTDMITQSIASVEQQVIQYPSRVVAECNRKRTVPDAGVVSRCWIVVAWDLDLQAFHFV